MIGEVLLDTSVLIDFLRRGGGKMTWFYELAKASDRLVISAMTQAELYSGKRIWKSKVAMRELTDLLSGIEVLPLSGSVSKLAGKLRAESGKDLMDMIIAATALENKLKLATVNKKHFKKIRGLRLLERA